MEGDSDVWRGAGRASSRRKSATKAGNDSGIRVFTRPGLRDPENISPVPSWLAETRNSGQAGSGVAGEGLTMVLERQGELTAASAAVLIVAKHGQGFLSLGQRLDQWGCHWSIADSVEGARRLLGQRGFADVLAVDGPCPPGSELARAVEASGSTLFRALPVEDSCWWLPVVEQGRECHQGRALRPFEFARVIQKLLEEWRIARNGGITRRLEADARWASSAEAHARKGGKDPAEPADLWGSYSH